MAEYVETVVVGAGQAGLAASYHLTRRGRQHLALEQSDAPGHVWRDQRWDSFALVTPNWALRMPGAEPPADPKAFIGRDALVEFFRQYASRHKLPIRYGVRVEKVLPAAPDTGYVVETAAGDFSCQNVIIATGLFQTPRLAAYARAISASVTQLHSTQYRNPGQLPAGAVLVVGSAQSGCQIAHELYHSGRKVFVSTSSAGRAPRRYRGRDCFEWLEDVGFLDRTPDKLPSPAARFAANPHVSGAHGGHDLNLHAFARDGVTLLGRLRGAEGVSLSFAPDLNDNLAKADKVEADICKLVDDYVEKQGLDAPRDPLPRLRHGYEQAGPTDLNLLAAGVTSIIWATGFGYSFEMLKLPVTDAEGFPAQKRGATEFPGLYFLGLPWLYKQKSGLLLGVGDDAAYIADRIAA